MARKDKLFADTGSKADRKDREAATRSHDRRLASLERLMKNADFRDWMFGTRTNTTSARRPILSAASVRQDR